MHTHTPPENKKDNNVLIMKTFAQSVEQILNFKATLDKLQYFNKKQTYI